MLVAIANWHSGPASFPAPPVPLPSRSDAWPQSDRLAPIFFSFLLFSLSFTLPSVLPTITHTQPWWSRTLQGEFYKSAESFFTAAPPVRGAKQIIFFFFASAVDPKGRN